MKLSIIIVNWNTRDLLLQCMESIDRFLKDVELEVIVIDNNSHDESTTTVEEKFAQTKIIKNKENIGPVKANNQGIKMSHSPYILLLNSDTYFIDSSMTSMLSMMERDNKIGVVAPQLLNEDLSPHTSFFNFPTLKGELAERYEFLLQWMGYRFSHTTLNTMQEPLQVDWLSSACMLIRRDIINEVGLFDENFFIYYDDVDFCRRVKNSSWKIFFYPRAKVVHLEGKSFNESRIRTETVKNIKNLNMKMKSQNYYIKKNWRILNWVTFVFLDIVASILRIGINSMRLILIKDFYYRLLLIRYEIFRMKFNISGM